MEYLSSCYPLGQNFADVGGGVGYQPTHTHDGKISALGIYTKFQSTPENTGLSDSRLTRLSRYTLQEISRELLPKERVTNCLRRRISKDTGVKIMFNPVREKAHYANVIRCGSVWTCPVCSAQISEKRRQELKKAVANWRADGGSVYLLTLTNPHYCGTNLKEMLQGQRKAIAYLWGDRKPKEMFKALGKEGHIIAAETTYSDVNGFHPHYHVLLFMRNEVNVQGLRSFLSTQWQNACRKAKLPIPHFDYGVDLQDGTYAEEYVSKWGLEDEMTKGHSKKGREGSLTPFDLLRQSVECPEYGELFKTYAKAFKGKQQLHWSRGLKARLGVFEQSDEELAQETEKEAIELRELHIEVWYLITKYKYRVEFLEAIEDDLKDNGERADSLVMKLAGYEVEQILKRADTG